MLLSVSTVQTFATCPVKWDWRYNKGLSALPTDALSDGINWHAVAAENRCVLPHDPKWLAGAYEEWKEERRAWDLNILGTEVPLSTALGPHTLIGRPDAIVEWNGHIWHLQHKSVRGSMPVPLYLDSLRLSWHEAAYRRMISVAYPHLPYGGSFLVLARKLTKPPFLVVSPVLVNEADALKALDELRMYANMMVSINMGAALIPNRLSCYGVFGNSKCDYYGACYEGTTAGLFKRDPYEGYI